MVWLCYIDEAGCTGALTGPNIQPVFAIVALAIPAPKLHSLTTSFLALKRRFYPRAANPDHSLDWVLLKGSELRKMATSPSRRKRRWAFGVLDHLLRLLETHEARIFGRIWIKPPNGRFDGRAIYTTSLQALFETFQHLLASRREDGVVIADSRKKSQNMNASHSLFTKRHSARGNPYPNILETPLFGHSDNHVGLQVADPLASALIYPMAVHAYCAHLTNNIHVHDYRPLHERYGRRLRALQHRYRRTGEERLRGGLTVSDPAGRRGGAHLFASRSG